MSIRCAFRFLSPSLLLLLLAACSSNKSDETTPVGGTGGASGGGAGGANNTGGQGGGGQGNAGTGKDLLIDDFEDGDGRSALGDYWYTYTDKDNGGGSTVTVPNATGTDFSATGEGYQSTHSLAVAYTFEQGTLAYDPYVGVGVSLGSAAVPRDLSQFAGIAYVYRGGAHQVRLETSDVTDYDFFQVAVPASTTWKTISMPFSLFLQEGWGKRATFNPADFTAVSFAIRGKTGTSNTLQIDDLKVKGSSGPAAPDMPINDPAPPAEEPIDSIAIDNPLQAVAERYLTRGYNITNWLEQDRFSGFTYDEGYVKQIAEAGFKSLRLPIDLDRYAEEVSGGAEELSFSVNDDLFTVLDAFDTWTQKYGLSLTIDYHQYDKSLTLADAKSLTLAVEIWGKVAEHFADSPREDLFYELLNEPELSFGGTAPTQTDWTTLAERMLAAIRKADTKHTIIFGDVNWYGIGPLSKRAPLSDSNVIYAFHDYDPFIFTHQGASWANLSSTHDLPYPYDKSRWSQYFSELGFSPLMEPWILSAARDYYRTGNRATLRNTILAAKKWAVSHDVPVICNEFGAYDGTSRLEDRARYLADITSVFNELRIPWQQWFMLLGKDGKVIPEYTAALGLDKP